MTNPVVADIFVEDRAHEEFLIPLLRRLAAEEDVSVSPRVRAARGGHARAIDELKLYQRVVIRRDSGFTCPDLLVVGIDGNCATFAHGRRKIQEATHASLSHRLVVACPDPHVERWYVADPETFNDVVGVTPTIGRKRCVRDHYKNLLAKAVRQAGHPPTLGGIEFARELVERMDLYRAGRNDRSLRALVDDLRNRLREAKQGIGDAD